MSARWLVPLSLLGACIDVPDEIEPECKVTADCDTANGEVCEEGTCWGNPPPGPFAALVSPPVARQGDLVSREIAFDSLPADGFLGDLPFEEAALFSGTILPVCPPPSTECEETQRAAKIVVTRPSRFKGGPGFRQSFDSDPKTGAFTLVLPRTTQDDVPYTITVLPEGRTNEPSAVTTAQLVPPMRRGFVVLGSSSDNTLELGALAMQTVEGKIINSVGNGQEKYRVVALGRWDESSPLTEVSTVDYTGADGTFSVRLSPDLPPDSLVELVARPYGNPLLPTLHMNVTTDSGTLAITNRTLVAPNVGSKVTVPFQIKGEAPGGEVAGVGGARVFVTGVIPPAQPGATSATFFAEGTTNSDGVVELDLLDGTTLASSYLVSVVPPPNAQVGVVFDRPVSQTDTQIRLPNRIALAGKVRDVTGEPLEGVQVTVRPSLRFQWSLDAAPQAFVAAIPAATAVTPKTGEYVVFVDPFVTDGVEDVWGYYDIAFEPTTSSRAPSWTELDVEIPRDTQLTSVPLPEITLPDAAHIHGFVVDPNGAPVEGAELKVFQVLGPTIQELCLQVPHAPASCPIPADLLGRGAADGDGEVRLTLPRP